MNSTKNTYLEFCKNLPILIFQSPKWLNTVVGENNWNVVLALKGNRIVGAMPYVTKQNLIFKQITLPVFTPYLGPIFNPPTDLAVKNLDAFKTKTTLELISQLPKVDRFATQCDFEFKNWLPFHWNGFKQRTKYSYILDTKADLDLLQNNLGANIKKDLKKASEITITVADDCQHIIGIVQTDYSRKNQPQFFRPEQFKNIFQSFKDSKQVVVFNASQNNDVIASIAVAFDMQYAHYILGGVNYSHRNSGVMSKLLWTAIQEAKQRKVAFNFEGSMHQGIGQYFKSFGGTLTPYHQITKVSHPVLKHLSLFNF